MSWRRCCVLSPNHQMTRILICPVAGDVNFIGSKKKCVNGTCNQKGSFVWKTEMSKKYEIIHESREDSSGTTWV